MTNGTQILLDWMAAKKLTAETLRARLIAAAGKDRLLRPDRDVPQLRTLRRWIAGLDTPAHKGRRLLAIASGGRIRKDESVSGGAVPVESWS